jgi:hypothetical protein
MRLVWRRTAAEPVEQEHLVAIMKFLMGMDAKLDETLALLREDEDGGEELDA